MTESSHHAVELTDANFAEEVQKFQGVVLVDFWAAWCGPCLMMAPKLEELAGKLKDNPDIKIAKLNVDENIATANVFNIMSLPTFKFFANGQVVDEQIGASPIQVLEAKLQEVIKQNS